jgi:2'-5' RNA ligase
MEQLRVFVAVDVPAALQGKLGAAAASLRRLPGDARWVYAAYPHLTLRFLGDWESSAVWRASAAVERVATRHRPFSLTLAGLGLFPEHGAPQVVWLGVERGRPGLVALQRDLETELGLAGFPPGERAFRPHVTLARLRRAEPGPWREAVRRLGRDPVVSFAVEQIRVMRSELTRRGPVYTVLSAAPLSGAPPQPLTERGE